MQSFERGQPSLEPADLFAGTAAEKLVMDSAVILDPREQTLAKYQRLEDVAKRIDRADGSRLAAENLPEINEALDLAHLIELLAYPLKLVLSFRTRHGYLPQRTGLAQGKKDARERSEINKGADNALRSCDAISRE